MIATIPNSEGLYEIAATKQATEVQAANVVSGKMTISEAHKKLGHILCGAIKHTISKGFITGITLDLNSKPVRRHPASSLISTLPYIPPY
jgi:hypothetical protein